MCMQWLLCFIYERFAAYDSKEEREEEGEEEINSFYFHSSSDMANDSSSSPIKPYQQIIASGSGAVLTALFMTLVIFKLYSRLKT